MNLEIELDKIRVNLVQVKEAIANMHQENETLQMMLTEVLKERCEGCYASCEECKWSKFKSDIT